MSNVQKLIAFIVALGLILIGIFGFGLYPKGDPKPFNFAQGKPIETSKQEVQDQNGVKVVSTNPDPLDDGIVSPTATIEITFNKPLVRDDTRIVLEPIADYKTDLSPDHKTLKITPEKSFELGKDYTLTIKNGYGTDTGEKLDSDLIFHFKTITYTGV